MSTTIAFATGDCVFSGTVYFADYSLLEGCFAGPDSGLGTSCDFFDFDLDDDVDMTNFTEFQIPR